MSDPRVTLSQINLVASDVPAVVEFYRLLGVEIAELTAPWAAWEPHHRTANLEGSTELDFDLDSLAFARSWGSQDVPAGVLLGFRVDSREGVDALYERVTGAGHTGLRAPYDAFWGARYAIVLDPSGVAVGLMSAADPALRSTPPDLSDFAPDSP
jgi:uncharacterized glyoxalase superfamily protein PhnB